MLKLNGNNKPFNFHARPYVLYIDTLRGKEWEIYGDNCIAAADLYFVPDTWKDITPSELEELYPEHYQTYQRHKFLWE